MTAIHRTSQPMQRVERYETIVIGGGQAGLSAAYFLARDDHDFIVLDGGERVGDVWRSRWDTLRLFTPARYSALPGLSFPAAAYHLPSKDEVADYFELYADSFDLPVRLRSRVSALRYANGRFQVATSDLRYEADNIIVATGPFQAPRIPEWARALDPSILQLHSSDYRNPAQLAEGGVLVVGAGNSGAQIAIELAASRRVWLSGRDTGRLPRRRLGRDIYDWLWPTLLRTTRDSMLGRSLRRRSVSGDPLVGITARDLELPGLARVGRTTGVQEGRPVLDDGRELDPRSIIWCTGFRPDFGWIDLSVFDGAGLPVHERGVVAGAPGLYFLGLRFLHRLRSALLGGVGEDAEHVVRQIARRQPEAAAA